MLRSTHFLVIAGALMFASCSQPQPAPTETAAPHAELAATGAVVVTAPASGARVTSPLIVEGTATGDWFFEAQFPVKLVAADGTVLAEAPARAQDDWMTEAPVPYRAELVFIAAQETQATLVLQEDMPADNAAPREVTVPVVLLPR